MRNTAILAAFAAAVAGVASVPLVDDNTGTPPRPNIPHSFRAEFALEQTAGGMMQAGAGYIVIDATAGPKGQTRSRALRPAALLQLLLLSVQVQCKQAALARSHCILQLDCLAPLARCPCSTLVHQPAHNQCHVACCRPAGEHCCSWASVRPHTRHDWRLQHQGPNGVHLPKLHGHHGLQLCHFACNWQCRNRFQLHRFRVSPAVNNCSVNVIVLVFVHSLTDRLSQVRWGCHYWH
jgi:hypothetical protein